MAQFELTTEMVIDMKQEVEPKILKFIPNLNKKFIYRVLAFSLSGTEIVDLKSTDCKEAEMNTKDAQIACRFKSSFLTNFLCHIVFNTRKVESASQKDKVCSPKSVTDQNIVLSEKFQEVINIELMNLNVCLIYNDILCVATFASIDPDTQTTQSLISRYFFAQFWCEFTKEVLTEFLNEDFIIREMQAEKLLRKTGGENQESDGSLKPVRSSSLRKNQGSKMFLKQKDGSLRLSNELHEQILAQQIYTMNHSPRLANGDGNMQMHSDRQRASNSFIDEKNGQSSVSVAGAEKPQESMKNNNDDQKQDGQESPEEEDVTRRNFYLTLFRLYSDIPYHDCLQSFAKIFNDVFVLEKPGSIQKYFLTEVQVVEMKEAPEEAEGKLDETHSVPFKFNFANGTSRQVNYLASDYFNSFLNKAIRQIKKADSAQGSKLDLHKRGRKAHGQQASQHTPTQPQNGYEFFFSNVMLKAYQVPMLFARNSDETISPEEGCFMVLIFEKQTRKRTFAKTSSQFQRLKRSSDMKKIGENRYVEEMLLQRDSKMRRFSNYFVTLFNQKKINPFTQFIPQAKLKIVKQKVREKMDQYTNGEKPEAEEQKSGEASKKSIQAQDKAESSGTDRKQPKPTDDKAEARAQQQKSVKSLAQTPVPQLSGTASMDDLHELARLRTNLSKVSLNFGSRSNLSSICHMEEISEGRASIDKIEYKIQKKKNPQTERDVRSSQAIRNPSAQDDEPSQKGQVNLEDNPYDDGVSRNQVRKQTAVFKKQDTMKKTKFKEGDLMRASAQNIPSAGQLKSQASEISLQGRSLKHNDSLFSLFANIREIPQTCSGQDEVKSQASSFSGISKDLANGLRPVESVSKLSEENNKEVKVESRVQKKTRVHLKGFALGHGAAMRKSSMENIEEREEEQKMDTQQVKLHIQNAHNIDCDPHTPVKNRPDALRIDVDGGQARSEIKTGEADLKSGMNRGVLSPSVGVASPSPRNRNQSMSEMTDDSEYDSEEESEEEESSSQQMEFQEQPEKKNK